MRTSITILILMMVALLPLQSEASTITVGPEGYDCTSIQAAIDAAIPGDTIEVQSGTYRENVNVNKALTLKGIGMPVVDAGRNGDAITLSADGIWLEGFVATNANKSWLDAGIKVISNDNTIVGNRATGNRDGIWLSSSSNNTMRDNQMLGNRYNFEAFGYNDIDTSNLVDGKPVYYLVGASDRVIDSSSDAGAVYCIDCENITARGLTLKNNIYGIYFHNTSNSTVENNNITGNIGGIYLVSSGNNAVVNNKVIDSDYCIDLSSSNNNTVANNDVVDNYCGIYLDSSSSNTIKKNNVSDGNYGIDLEKSSNNIIVRNNANGNTYAGIYVSSSSNNTIDGNNAIGNNYGIWLYSSSNNSLRCNLMSGNRYNFRAHGRNDIDTSNLVDGRRVYYLVGASDRVIDSSSGAGVVYCIDCENITVTGLTLKNNRYGICFDNTSSSKVENNDASGNNGCGIHLYSSSNNSIENNNVSDNYDGIRLYSSANNVVEGNSATGNDCGIRLEESGNNIIEGGNNSANYYGIRLDSSSNNTILGNSATNNYHGLWLKSSHNNTVLRNSAVSNSYYGISLSSSSNNTIFMNDLVNNKICNARDDGANRWDDETFGNYYSDLECTDPDEDGICDSPYEIPGGESVDWYPFARLAWKQA